MFDLKHLGKFNTKIDLPFDLVRDLEVDSVSD